MSHTLYEDAQAIVRASFMAQRPESAVRRALASFRRPRGRLIVVAIGKAAWAMARATLEVVPDVDAGIVITKTGHIEGPLPPLVCHEASHPIPDDRGVAATRDALALVDPLGRDDGVIFLVSGGGSALFESPRVPLQTLKACTNRLLQAGANITEINTIRKRLSDVKGGRFALRCAPASVFSVVLSDIVGDPLDMIASGPAVADRSSSAEARRLAAHYELPLPKEAWPLLDEETPKTIDNVDTVITGSVRHLCQAAAAAARDRGYTTVVLSDRVTSEARVVGAILGAVAHTHAGTGRLAFVCGGEPIVHVRGRGLGGRNQEVALAAAIALDGVAHAAVVAAGSDGTDGPTDAAGGYADGSVCATMRRCGVDPEAALDDNDAYHALACANALIHTGPTGTNVNDVMVVLTEPRPADGDVAR